MEALTNDQFVALAAQLGQIAIFAFAMERVLDFVFDYHHIRKRLEARHGIKAVVALSVAVSFCFWKKIDIVSTTLGGAPGPVGYVFTAFFVAGGSGAAMALFHNVLGISQAVRRERRETVLAERDTERLRQEAERNILLEQIRRSREELSSRSRLLLAGSNSLSLGSAGSDVGQLQRFLVHFGYLEKRSFEVGRFDEPTDAAVKKYQTFMGLKVDGLVGPITRRDLHTRRCGVKDTENQFGAAARADCRWPGNRVTYGIRRHAPGVNQKRCEELIREAFDYWTEACGLTFKKTNSLSDANILIVWEDPDYEEEIAPYSVYAFGYKPPPCGGARSGRILLDEKETWLDDDEPSNVDGYYIRLTLAHEVGHAIGLDHSTGQTDVMHAKPHVAGPRPLSQADKDAASALYA